MNDSPPQISYIAELGDRSLFPELSARSYLNHAAISPLSLAAQTQAQQVLCDYAKGGLEGFFRWLPQRQRYRESLGKLIGANASDIGFCQNTSAGVVSIAHMLPWKKGDRVLLFQGEFPTNITPWQQAAETYGLEVVWLSLDSFFRSHEEGLAELKSELERGLRLVAVSAVQFQTGLRMPVNKIGELCHQYGAELFVDAIQALGAVPFNVDSIDYLSCGGHKWLMGMEGAGFVYIAPQRKDTLIPRLAGWLGHEDAFAFLLQGEEGHLRYDRPLRKEASVIEQGAQSTIALAAGEGALDLILQLGVQKIFSHINAFHDRLESQLVQQGFQSARTSEKDGRSATLSVRLPKDVDLLSFAASLGRERIAVTSPDGWLRFAPHWPNALEETDFILATIEKILNTAN